MLLFEGDQLDNSSDNQLGRGTGRKVQGLAEKGCGDGLWHQGYQGQQLQSIKGRGRQSKVQMQNRPRISHQTTGSTHPRQKFLTGNHHDPLPLLRSPDPLPSHSLLTQPHQPDNYTRQQLTEAFNKISTHKPYILAQDLQQFLIDQNQDPFKKYQMIRLLDAEGKGYVTLEEFLGFYLDGRVAGQLDCPQGYGRRRAWREAVEGEYGWLRGLAEREYCEFVVGEVARLKEIEIGGMEKEKGDKAKEKGKEKGKEAKQGRDRGKRQ